MEKKEKIYYTYFQISCDSTRIGRNVYVIGDINSLGNWDPNKSVRLYTNSFSFPVWKSKVHELKCENDKFEYKYIIKDDKGKDILWENFRENRVVKLTDIDNCAKNEIEYSVEIQDDSFGINKIPKIFIAPLKQKLRELVEESHIQEKAHMDQEDNNDGKENHKKYEYSNYLESIHLKDLVNTFVKENNQNKTWKEKLSFIWDIIKNKKLLDKELLALVSVYLFYINSGQIKCSEDGQHYRPNHHSSLAYSIFTYLMTIPGDDYSLIIRSIFKNLPSFSDKYMVNVPLTRIRDIAHRNDIPQDLKKEIKTTLQNKLHRSASPEDLKTCENILKIITSRETNYSKDFINEFKIFYEELKEFFNALGLEKSLDKLNDLLPNNLSDIKEELNKMIKIKHESVEKSLEKIEQVIRLRGLLNKIINDYMESNSNKGSKSLIQISLTCDIELENLSYTILSEYVEKYFYSNTNKNMKEDGYQKLIKICILCLDSMILSKNKILECKIIKDDIIYFSDKFIFDFSSDKENLIEKHRLAALKLKSVLERCLNLFYEITDDVNRYFNVPVYALGKALKINPHSIQVYCESFVRAHIIFQFSKIVTLLLHKIRNILNLPPFISLSTGTVNGYYLHIKNLSDFNPDKHQDKDYVIFLNESDGTEEIPNVIKAVILSHDLPQLSHLAIRARQNKVVFICVLEKSIFKYDYVKRFQVGDYLTVNVNGDESIKIEKVEKKNFPNLAYENLNVIKKKDSKLVKSEEEQNQQKDQEQEPIPNNDSEFDEIIKKIDSNPKISWPIIAIEDSNQDLAGSKCTNMKELVKIKDDNYNTPRSLCIPYEVYLKFVDSILNEKDLSEIDNCPFEELEKMSEYIREKFISNAINSNEDLELIVNEINQKLPEDFPLAIRSSSNLEDLKKSAGAGLFDSYLGIKNNKNYKDEIKYNICKVWASLFTVRALIARRNNKIPSNKAKMGILIQEMIDLHFAFVIHTVNPINKDNNQVFIEIVIGMGETLANPKQRGSPYRLIYFKKEDKVRINNYSSFSYKIKNGKEEEKISYINEILSTDDEYIINLGRRLGKISLRVEDYFNGIPQDLEGGSLEDKIYMMQTRPQII